MFDLLGLGFDHVFSCELNQKKRNFIKLMFPEVGRGARTVPRCGLRCACVCSVSMMQ